MVPAGLSGYGTDWDRLALGGVTVPDLLLIDLVVGAVLIMVAAVIIVRRGRSPGPSPRPGEVAGLDGEETVQAQMPVVPGFSGGAAGPDPSLNGLHRAAREPDPGAREPDPGAREPGLGARESAGPEQEASPQVSRAADAGPGTREPAAPEQEASPQVSRAGVAGPGGRKPAGPEQEASPPVSGAGDAGPGGRKPAGPEREASPQVSGAAGAGPGSRAPVAELNGRPGPGGVVTSSGRVSSYYEGADQPIADYLAELGWDEEPGWAEEPGARDPR